MLWTTLIHIMLLQNFVLAIKSDNELKSEEKAILKKAIQDNDIKLFESMLEQRKNKNPLFNAKTGDTLLHHLAGERDIVAFLKTVVEQVPDRSLFTKNKAGEYPIDKAAKEDNHKIAEYIITAGIEFFHIQRKADGILGFQYLKNALKISGELGHLETFGVLFAAMRGANQHLGKEQEVIDYAKRISENFSPTVSSYVSASALVTREGLQEHLTKAMEKNPTDEIFQYIHKYSTKDSSKDMIEPEDKAFEQAFSVIKVLKYVEETSEKILDLIEMRNTTSYKELDPKVQEGFFDRISKSLDSHQKYLNTIMFTQSLSSLRTAEDGKNYADMEEILDGLKKFKKNVYTRPDL